jgi:polar amino acid transport system permease protein
MPLATSKRRGLNWIDIAVFSALALLVAFTAYRIEVSLNYRWNWAIVPRYLLRWDDEKQAWIANLLLVGFLTTLRLALWGSLIAGLIGLTMGLCRISDDLFLRLIGRLYVEFVRNLPPLVFIFIFYFFISSQIMPLFDLDGLVQDAAPSTLGVIDLFFGEPGQLADFIPGLLAIGLFEGAYITEIIRAGIRSIEKGQWEASTALGLGRVETLRRIVLPQAIQRIIPALTGQFVSLIKDSAIVSLISVPELTFRGSQVTASTGSIFEVWITVAGLYFILCFTCSRIFARFHGVAKTKAAHGL